MFARDQLVRRLRACIAHLLLSLLVAAAVACLVLLVWYPAEYGILAGGKGLFWLVVTVDVVMGPLLTLVVFDVRKPRRELVRDLTIIGCLQLAALGYGLHSAYQARPVALVHEVDRFRVIIAADVRLEELPQARKEYQTLPAGGPWLLGTRASRSPEERLGAVSLALQGFDIGQRPSYWQPYEDSKPLVRERAIPVERLFQKYPDAVQELEARLDALGLDRETARFLPVMARVPGWVVLLRPSGDVAGFAPYDGFF